MSLCPFEAMKDLRSSCLVDMYPRYRRYVWHVGIVGMSSQWNRHCSCDKHAINAQSCLLIVRTASRRSMHIASGIEALMWEDLPEVPISDRHSMTSALGTGTVDSYIFFL